MPTAIWALDSDKNADKNADIKSTPKSTSAVRITAKEAEDMVKKAVVYFKENGRSKGIAEVNNKKGQFVDRELYLSVYQMDGLSVAHGANEKFVGKNLLDLKDIDGKEYVKERLELAKSKKSFWQDYKFSNPVTKKIEPKSMYCETTLDVVICGGIYK